MTIKITDLHARAEARRVVAPARQVTLEQIDVASWRLKSSLQSLTNVSGHLEARLDRFSRTPSTALRDELVAMFENGQHLVTGLAQAWLIDELPDRPASSAPHPSGRLELSADRSLIPDLLLEDLVARLERLDLVLERLNPGIDLPDGSLPVDGIHEDTSISVGAGSAVNAPAGDDLENVTSRTNVPAEVVARDEASLSDPFPPATESLVVGGATPTASPTRPSEGGLVA